MHSTVPPCLRQRPSLVYAVTGIPVPVYCPKRGSAGGSEAVPPSPLRRILTANVSLSERRWMVFSPSSPFYVANIAPKPPSVKPPQTFSKILFLFSRFFLRSHIFSPCFGQILSSYGGHFPKNCSSFFTNCLISICQNSRYLRNVNINVVKFIYCNFIRFSVYFSQ